MFQYVIVFKGALTCIKKAFQKTNLKIILKRTLSKIYKWNI